MSDQNMSAADIAICLTTFRAERKGAWTEELTAREVRMLSVLLASPGLERDRRALTTTLWGPKEPTTKNVEVLVSRLRKKLAPLGVTIPHRDGESYKLVL